MTLHYDFPSIQWWHTVAKHFEGNENFVVVDKGDYFVVNYVRMGKETHPPVVDEDYRRAAVLREARGLIFSSKTGELLSRPFHKFFNLGEREDVMEADLSRPHVIMEKLDGSMIRPIPLESGIRWGTKMGITDVAMQAEEFVAKNPQYHKFAASCGTEWTPLFEWCSRQQRIVVDYPQDKLVLLAMRHNWTGHYMGRDELVRTARHWNLPVVETVDASNLTQEQLVEHVRAMSDMEGVVVQFDDGHMVKIKADQYIALHRAKSLLENERDVVGLVLDEKTDDLKPLLPPADRARLEQFETDVWADVFCYASRVNNILRGTEGMERKEFALKTEGILDPITRGSVFKLWEDRNCTPQFVIDVVRRHLGSKAAYEKIGVILCTASWKEVKIDE